MLGSPEAGVARVDLLHDVVVQAADVDDAGTEAARAIELTRAVELAEVVATQLVAHEHVVHALAEAVEQPLEQVHAVAAAVHDVPVVERDAGEVGHVEHAGFVHPAHQRLLRLRRQIDEHAPAGLFDGGLDDAVQRLVAVDQGGRSEIGIEAQQRAVRAVGIEADEGQLLVDEVLRQQTRHHRLADPALLPTDQVDLRHGVRFQGGDVFHALHCARQAVPLASAARRLVSVMSSSAMPRLSRFQPMPLTKAAWYEPVRSKTLPDIQPPSAMPSSVAISTAPTRAPASAGGKCSRTMIA